MARATTGEGNVQFPTEANSGGKLNETTPAEQRVPQARMKETNGPKVGSNGAYLPAVYTHERSVEMRNGQMHVAKIRREDR